MISTQTDLLENGTNIAMINYLTHKVKTERTLENNKYCDNQHMKMTINYLTHEQVS